MEGVFFYPLASRTVEPALTLDMKQGIIHLALKIRYSDGKVSSKSKVEHSYTLPLWVETLNFSLSDMAERFFIGHFWCLKRMRLKMENRIALLAIIVKNPENVGKLNELLHQYSQYIIGRLGIPHKARGLSIISVAMDAPADEISALSGKIGKLEGVTSKTVYAPNDAV